MSKRTCKHCGEEIKTEHQCVGCDRSCAKECGKCGLPICAECVGTDKDREHEAACGELAVATKLHDGTYIGIEIHTDRLRLDIVQPKRMLNPDDFKGQTVGRLIHADDVLQNYVMDVAKKQKYIVEIYGAHVDEIGTGVKLVSQLTAKFLAPVHVQGFAREEKDKAATPRVIVVLINTKKNKAEYLKNPKGDPKYNVELYGNAVKYIYDHQKIVPMLIKGAGDRAVERTGKK